MRTAIRPPRGATSAALVCALIARTVPASAQELTATVEEDKVVVRVGDELFAEYRYQDDWTPYLYPLVGPGGARMTRNWPMAEAPGETRDHPHQRGLWFAHGSVNGLDFWHATDTRIRHDAFDRIEPDGEDGVVVAARNTWTGPDGLVCRERRTMRFAASELGRTIDFAITLSAGEHDLRFGDTKEGTFALRLAPTLRLKGEVATGHCISSEGARDGDCWGKRARWMDYWGEIDGRTVGIAIFDHPQNPSFPPWWHARDYGLFAANPFGVHDFENKPAGTGDLLVASGEALTFRYRVLLHGGPADAGALEAAFESWARRPLRRDPLRGVGAVELVRDGFRFTEGPAWVPAQGALLFSDIPANRIYRLDATGEIDVFREPSHQANGLLVDAQGRLFACEHGGRRVSITEPGEEPRALVWGLDGVRLNSPNDLVLRRDGNLYFTDPPYGLDGRPSDLGACHVLRLDPQEKLHVVWKGDLDTRPNGVALSPDERTLYVAFSAAGDVRRFDVAQDGSTSEQHAFVQTSGGPDGMAIDEDGNLYVCAAAGVEVFAPDGERRGAIAVPQRPANCAFGGADGRTLFVTARTGLYRTRVRIPGLR